MGAQNSEGLPVAQQLSVLPHPASSTCYTGTSTTPEMCLYFDALCFTFPIFYANPSKLI